jgi:hypothetical protein
LQDTAAIQVSLEIVASAVPGREQNKQSAIGFLLGEDLASRSEASKTPRKLDDPAGGNNESARLNVSHYRIEFCAPRATTKDEQRNARESNKPKY